MKHPLDQTAIVQALDWAYGKVLEGLAGSDSAEQLALCYTRQAGTSVDHCNSLIRWQVAKASASGFLTGLGGLITLPVAIPANIGVVLYVQIRMIAAIAHIGGFDIRDDQVRSLVYLCLRGNTAAEVVKAVGIKLGENFAREAIGRIAGQTLVQINQSVGFRLLTKFGQTGVINLGSAVPLVGGVIGGALDGTLTRSVGVTARRMFVESTATVGIGATES
jgi:hypothetical protein